MDEQAQMDTARQLLERLAGSFIAGIGAHPHTGELVLVTTKGDTTLNLVVAVEDGELAFYEMQTQGTPQ